MTNQETVNPTPTLESVYRLGPRALDRTFELSAVVSVSSSLYLVIELSACIADDLDTCAEQSTAAETSLQLHADKVEAADRSDGYGNNYARLTGDQPRI
jgi:hypothetical protein